MAQAFGECGVDTRIVYPWSPGSLPWRDVASAYGLRRAPARLVLPAVHCTGALRRLGTVTTRLSLAAFARGVGRDAVVLARHPRYDPLATLLRLKARGAFGGRIFVELHEAQHLVPAQDPHVGGYIVVSEPLQAFLRSAGIEPGRVLLAPNGVDLRSFESLHAAEPREMRRELGLPADRAILCYTGQLGPGRNVETLVASLRHLPAETMLVLVGGNRGEDRQRIQAFVASQALSDRVVLRGHEPAARAWRLQMAADVLVIPYAAYMAHAEWCSPLKLGEYLATGVPIVAFPLPSLKAVLRDEDVVWATEETSRGLAEAVLDALKRLPRPFAEVERRLAGWSWTDRARRMAAFMGLAAPGAGPGTT
jgi:glycosyltransferase involved in cell wall biosynthesis